MDKARKPVPKHCTTVCVLVCVVGLAFALDACTDDGPDESAFVADVEASDDAPLDAGDSSGPQNEIGDAQSGLDALTNDIDVDAQGPTALKVITFNVLCSICDREGYHPWAERLDEIQGILAEYDADLLGIQELVWAEEDHDEVAALMALHPEYTALYHIGQGMGLLGSFSAYPDSTLYFRTSRFDILESGTFWLSPTPDEPYSTGFADAVLPRLMVWAKLHDLESGQELLFCNSHFDPNSPSQALSVPVVFERLGDAIASMPTFMVGDFNSNPASEAYGLMTQGSGETQWELTDSYTVASDVEIVHSQGDETPYAAQSRIDHIFFRGESTSVAHWLVDLRKFGEPPLYPSDHRLMMATFEY
jgi:endonuclease/exonuclease/phosphatase family metal-dependent hydrolase